MRFALADIRRHLQDQPSSGLSVGSYCQRHGLNVWTFRGWKKRESSRAILPPTSSPFLRVDLPTPQHVEIVTSSRATIRIPCGMDCAALGSLLLAIKRSRIV